MGIEILTKEDLQQFKKELLDELRLILKSQTPQKSKSWLRSAEVRQLLNISPNTLVTMRVNGLIAYSKIGSIYYYKLEDIQKKLEAGKRS